MRIMGLSEGRVPASHGSEKGVRRHVFQLKFADEAQPSEGNGLITPKVLSPSRILNIGGAARLLVSRGAEAIATSLDM
jgi:hypothetical protein